MEGRGMKTSSRRRRRHDNKEMMASAKRDPTWCTRRIRTNMNGLLPVLAASAAIYFCLCSEWATLVDCQSAPSPTTATSSSSSIPTSAGASGPPSPSGSAPTPSLGSRSQSGSEPSITSVGAPASIPLSSIDSPPSVGSMPAVTGTPPAASASAAAAAGGGLSTTIAAGSSSSIAPTSSSLRHEDILIHWDAEPQSSTSIEYKVKVRIENKNPYVGVSKTDGWELGFTWDHDEFIWSCEGCEATTKPDCSNLVQIYGMVNISLAHTCDRSPVLLDIDRSRNGSLSSPILDPGGAVAELSLSIGKRMGDNIYPPSNFSIGTKGFVCDVVRPRQSSSSSSSSWSIACGPPALKTEELEPARVRQRRTCCVSFSAVFNRTLAPCLSCACSSTSRECSAPSSSCDASSFSSFQPAMDASLGKSLKDYSLPSMSKSQEKGRCETGCGRQIHFHVGEVSEDADGIGPDRGGWTLMVRIENLESAAAVEKWMLAARFEPLVTGGTALAPSSAGVVNSTFARRDLEEPLLAFFGKQGNEVLLQKGSIYFEVDVNATEILAGALGVPAEIIHPEKKLTENETYALRADQKAFPTRVLFMGEECDMPNPMYIPSLPNRSLPSVTFSPPNWQATLSFALLSSLIASLLHLP